MAHARYGRGAMRAQWRILVCDGLAAPGLELLGLEEVGALDALVVRGRTKVTEEILASGVPRLKVVGRAGVGVDNIDLDAARALGVSVVNAPHAATTAVAEHTLALMLALARRIPPAA